MADFPSPAGFISDLDQGSPTNADRVFGSDDFHRNIRETMLNQFPNGNAGDGIGLDAAVNTTPDEMNTLDGIDTGTPLETRIAAIETQLNSLQGAVDPIGRIVAWPIQEASLTQTLTGSLAPGQGTWHWCDGSVLDGSTTYSGLFTLIGNQYGGTDAASMQIPKILGRVIAGRGTGVDLTGYRQGVSDAVQGNVGGEESHVQVEGELARHNHALANRQTSGDNTGIQPAGTTGTPIVNFNTNNKGDDEAFNVVQPTIILAFYIRVL